MKLQELLILGFALLSISWMGCDGSDPERKCGDCLVESTDGSRLDTATARDIRLRANAAFEQSSDHRSRFESRIGPQPWPGDLPANWPTPSSALVLADTLDRKSGRLLLVNLAGPFDQALASYRSALETGGFEVDRSHNTLHAKRDRVIATLNFFAREDSTRLEILFIANSPDPSG